MLKITVSISVTGKHALLLCRYERDICLNPARIYTKNFNNEHDFCMWEYLVMHAINACLHSKNIINERQHCKAYVTGGKYSSNRKKTYMPVNQN